MKKCKEAASFLHLIATAIRNPPAIHVRIMAIPTGVASSDLSMPMRKPMSVNMYVSTSSKSPVAMHFVLQLFNTSFSDGV